MNANSNPAKAIFLEAVEKHGPDQWSSFLDRACAGQPELRRRVEMLLQAHRDIGTDLNPAVGQGPAPSPVATVDEPIRERPGSVIGPYKLLEQIGEGSFGVVFDALHQQLSKRVALKVLKPGMDTRQVVARFEVERYALALMNHPNIAHILDGGETPTGRPYFVMELVRGIPITEFCDQNRLSISQRLVLFVDVCQAVQHAHQKGIIHRDLKPSNVMVTLDGSTPVVKVIDFGIAKALWQQLTGKTVHTGLAQMIGTPLYMSPEQTGMSGLDVDTRSDIYSLGVLLYELLTGTTPFDRTQLHSVDYDEVRRLIREEEPPRPSTRVTSLAQTAATICTQRQSEPKRLSQLFRGELDWIVLKALEKDRNRRYKSADDFAADVQRYLHRDEPVQACPPSAWYRLRKFARRNKSGLSVAGLVLFFLVFLGGGAGWAVRDRVEREQKAAKERLDRLQRLTTQVEFILQEVDRLEQKQKWPEALASIKRAEAVLNSGEADDAIQQHVGERRRELDFVAQLERIRQNRAIMIEGKFNNASAVWDYAAAFRDYGADVEALPTEEAVARLRGNPALAVPLAAALDDWVTARRNLNETEPRWKPLVAVARGLDPDPLRDRLRAMWGQPATLESSAVLLGLAKSIEVKAQSPATLYTLAKTLERVKLLDAAIQILQEGQYAYPADFWLNHLLQFLLEARKDYEGAIRYASVAVSLRPDSAGAHHNLGVALYHNKQWDEAIRECRRAIELDPKSAASHCNFGAALLAKGPLDDAIREYRRAIELNPKDAVYHSGLGFALSKKGRLDDAIRECRIAIELDPKNAGAHHNLGIALEIGKNQLDEAIREYRIAIELDPKDAGAHNHLGYALSDKNQLDEAIREYRIAIELDPKNVAAHINLGSALYDKKQLDEAIREYRIAIELDPKNAAAHDNLGIALQHEGHLDEGIREYYRAIELDPKYANPHFNLGLSLHRDKKQLDQAIREYRAGIELDPKCATAHDGLGTALRGKNELDEAIREHRIAIELEPKYAIAHNNLGNALRDKKQLDEAIREYRTAIQLDPKLAPAHSSLGNILCDEGQLDEAIREHRWALELDPKNALDHLNLGYALHRKGRVDEAIAEYKRAIELDPRYALSHNNLGFALKDKGRVDEAIAEYKRAIELNPKLAWSYSGLVAALLESKQWAEAIRACRAAIELGPKNASSYVNLGWVLLETKQLEESIRASRTAIELDPKNAAAHNNLGCALRDNGQLDEAIRAFRKAIELDPKYVNPRFNLRRVYASLSRLNEAIAEFNKEIELEPKHAGKHNELAWLLATCPDPKLRDPQRAVELTKKAVALAPSEGNYWNTLGAAHYRAGDWKAAVAALKKSMELRKGGDSEDFLFLAMAHWQLGEKDQARQWYDRAVQWMDKYQPKSDELRRFRSEAAKLLGMETKSN